MTDGPEVVKYFALQNFCSGLLYSPFAIDSKIRFLTIFATLPKRVSRPNNMLSVWCGAGREETRNPFVVFLDGERSII